MKMKKIFLTIISFLSIIFIVSAGLFSICIKDNDGSPIGY